MIKVSGIVVEGKQKGRKLGFPTANIKLGERLESGVYAGSADIDGKSYLAAIFVNQSGLFLEFHLLDFSGHIYGQEIEVSIGKKIREVENFGSDEELKKKITEDIKIIKSL